MNEFSFNPNNYEKFMEGNFLFYQQTPKFNDSENTMHIEKDDKCDSA